MLLPVFMDSNRLLAPAPFLANAQAQECYQSISSSSISQSVHLPCSCQVGCKITTLEQDNSVTQSQVITNTETQMKKRNHKKKQPYFEETAVVGVSLSQE